MVRDIFNKSHFDCYRKINSRNIGRDRKVRSESEACPWSLNKVANILKRLKIGSLLAVEECRLESTTRRLTSKLLRIKKPQEIFRS